MRVNALRALKQVPLVDNVPAFYCPHPGRPCFWAQKKDTCFQVSFLLVLRFVPASGFRPQVPAGSLRRVQSKYTCGGSGQFRAPSANVL